MRANIGNIYRKRGQKERKKEREGNNFIFSCNDKFLFFSVIIIFKQSFFYFILYIYV